MSALPSPLKSPTCTSTQVAPVLQVAHGAGEVTKLVPVDRAVHQAPPSSQRPVMSALPSPLKSPTCTSTQVTLTPVVPVLQMVQTEVVTELPLDRATHHLPVFGSQPAMSVSPSPLKSPASTLAQ